MDRKKYQKTSGMGIQAWIEEVRRTSGGGSGGLFSRG